MEDIPPTTLYLCPSDKRYQCSWTGLSEDIFGHFLEEHERLAFYSNAIDIDLSASSENKLLLTGDEIYLAQTIPNEDTNCIQIQLRFLGPQDVANSLTFDINFTCEEDGIDLDKSQFVNRVDGGFQLNLEQLRHLHKGIEYVRCTFDVIKKEEREVEVSRNDADIKSNPLRRGHNPISSQSMRNENHRTRLRRRNTDSDRKSAYYENYLALASIKEYDCTVMCTNCSADLKPPIFLCPNDHNICGNCITTVCGTCNEKVTNNRNVELEEKCKTFYYQCKYVKNNCNERFALEDLEQHENKCTFCDYKCPIKECRAANCFAFQPMIKHLTVLHGSVKLHPNLIEKFPKNTEFFLSDLQKGIFYCTSSMSTESLTYSVFYCGPSVRKFLCEIKFSKHTRLPLILPPTGTVNEYSATIKLSEMKKMKFKDKHAVLVISMY